MIYPGGLFGVKLAKTVISIVNPKLQGKNHPLSHSNGVDSGAYPPQNEFDNNGYRTHLSAITNFGWDFFIFKNYPPHNLKFWKILVFEIIIF